MGENVFVRATIIGELPSGQKRIHLLCDGADGITFFSNEKSLLKASDFVSMGVHKQVMWERDVAMAQLHEHHIPFGGKAPNVLEVVRCKDCEHRGVEEYCPMYHVDEIEWDDDGYTETDYITHDYTTDNGFCDQGERKDNEE